MSENDEPKLIFKNSDFIVVEKPAGLLVHRVRVSSARRSRAIDEARRSEPTLAEWVVARYPEIAKVGDDPAFRPGIVHRLDKETSGVMVVARNQKAFEWLKAAFASRAMKKSYAALVTGVPVPAKGIIDRPIGMKAGSLKRSVHAATMAKAAVTEYKTKEIMNDGAYALLEVRPHTGRTHQIRVHLASIGHPIVGDPLYAAKASRPPSARLMLHAASLEFTDPAGTRFAFEAPLPADFIRVIHSVKSRDKADMVE
jgi:23S rRNA pseudouridine1911/1915/1917 synthase